ncbi:MAG: hypothetical protein HOJ13_02035 [Nitrospina sp.]|nr:hypothetical protein [Nitrospina sp.]
MISSKKLSNRFWKHGEQNLIDFGDKDNRSQDMENQKELKDEYQLEDR